LKNQIRFTQITQLIETVLENSKFNEINCLEVAIHADYEARKKAQEWVETAATTCIL
jgi:1-deoxy-D-xylulose 5-phosphate reductoisomerase